MSREWMDLLRSEKTFTYDKEGWFVPLTAAIDGLTAAQAAWQPSGGGNSIWQTVVHMNYYNERYLARFLGTPLGDAVADNDATFVWNAQDEAGWQAEVERTRRVGEGWQHALAELTDADLDRPIGQSTLGDQLPHLLLHVAYHTGQIILLRKQQGAWPAKRG